MSVYHCKIVCNKGPRIYIECFLFKPNLIKNKT